MSDVGCFPHPITQHGAVRISFCILLVEEQPGTTILSLTILRLNLALLRADRATRAFSSRPRQLRSFESCLL